MIPLPNQSHLPIRRAFTLIEMVTVIAILVTLMAAGVRLLNGTGSQSRKAGTDMLSGLIEQARTKAITSRSLVLLAIAEPGDLPAGDERCRVGLFSVAVDQWPDLSSAPATAVKGVLLSRWQTLNTGLVMLGGEVDGVANPLDQQEITITYGGSKNLSVKVHAIAFNSRGGLHHPPGSTPIVVRIAEGAYRGGKASANMRGAQKAISENRLKIGRVTARPYRFDG
jgi:prepilin-type N-terminal cleavage/methylation domain-containing protein